MKNNIRIREWQQSDASQLAKIANNINIWNNLRDAFPHPYLLQDAITYIELCTNGTILNQFAIECDEVLVGSIGYMQKTDVERISAEVGYFVGEEFWGRGITAEALKLLSDKVFSETEILRLFATPYSFNKASQKVLEKAKWRLSGVWEDTAIKNGVPVDFLCYELTKKNYLKQK